MKNSLFTRLLSLTLTVLMIASMLSFGVSATDELGEKSGVPTEPPVVEWKSDSKVHWQVVDGVAVGEEKHIPDVSSWSGDGETHYRECTVCGYKTNEAKCTEGEDGHCTVCLEAVAKHAVSNKWTTEKDSATHWKECVKCGEKFDEAAHEEGKNGSCVVCGTYVHVHAAKELKKDAAGHWFVCECGKMVDDKGNVVTKKTPHVDENKDGMCDDADCKYHNQHVAADPAKYTQTKTEHYQFCAECNTVINRETHKFGTDKVCDTCGYDVTVTHTCTPNPTWSYDKEKHWHACSCGETKFHQDNHTMENGKCTVCGYRGNYVVTPVIPNCSHTCCVGYPYCIVNHSCNNYNCSVCVKGYYAIYASAGVGGVISPEGYSVVSRGKNITYKFTSKVGYAISKVIVDGVNVGKVAYFTFSNVKSNHTIQVVFEKIACTIYDGCKLHDCCKGWDHCIFSTACKVHDFCQGYDHCVWPGYVSKPGCTLHPGCFGYSCCVYPNRSYVISVSGNVGGKLTPAGNSVIVAGNSITYSFTPNDGFIIDKVIVDGKDVGRVSSYTFSKVTSNHTLKVVFEKMKMPFLDVYSTDWYYEDVMYVWNNEIMQGTSYTTFSPKENITRAMIVTMLWRLEGSPASLGAQFKDVDPNSYYADAVRWAAKNGIVVGDDVGTFRPNDNINREELAAIIYRYAKFNGEGFVGNWAYKLGYSDFANISSWALEAVSYLSMKNIIVTDSAVSLNPKVNASRAEAAVVLHRLCEFIDN